jgi:dTDP-4-dehydrorhamnose reductase
MKIILTGATGLIGSRFTELMKDKHTIIPLSSKDVTITVTDSVDLFFEEKQADVVVHLAAKTDVDGCEKDKEEDQKLINKTIGLQAEVEKMNWDISDMFGNNSAFAINFYGTKNVYNAAKERGMKFVYISTDFVFPGEDKYNENSEADPLNWYGMTKYYGERLIDTSDDLIVRLSFPYGYPNDIKPDFVQKIIGLLRDGGEVPLIEDETITPTFIDDIVYGLEFLLQKQANGIYHLTGASYEDPYEIGKKIMKQFSFSTLIKPITREEVYKGRAARPFQSIMENAKIVGLGFEPKSFDEGLALIKKQ